jgi:ribosomal protein S18 acetylase RimI-like enzyme
MAKDISIRPCRPDECGKILELWRDAGSTPSISDSVDALKQMLRESTGLFLVAEFEGRIIGTVMGGWDGWRGNIYRLAILPKYRLRGIGRRLVQEAEKKLVDRGASKISILVEKSENTAVAFWDHMEKDGYRPDERMIRYAKSRQSNTC